jgi:hypothetical protein
LQDDGFDLKVSLDGGIKVGKNFYEHNQLAIVIYWFCQDKIQLSALPQHFFYETLRALTKMLIHVKRKISMGKLRKVFYPISLKHGSNYTEEN